jgi:hypothetical protein
MRARDLIGRKIVAVDFGRDWDGQQWLTRPVLTLDNGQRLSFVVQETHDGAEYGVSLCFRPKPQN